MSRSFIILFVSGVLVLVFQQVYSQDACERITTGDLGDSEMLSAGDSLLSSILAPAGESTVRVMVKILNVTIVCEAQHRMQDRYRYTSVVVSFNCFTTDARVPECNDSSVVDTEQFDFGCLNGEWTGIILTVSNAARTTNPTATLSTALDTNCIVCANPTNPEATNLPAAIDTDTHCSECANCPMGLQRCYYQQGSFTEVCCNYFHNGLCVQQCPDDFAPNDQFECEMQCPELVAANGIFTYTKQRLAGGVATLTCIEGYEAVNSPATCVTGTTWSHTPMCDVIRCSDVEELVNGVFSYEHESRVVNTTVTYECDPGFYLNGNSTRTCTIDRTWVPSPGPTCAPIIECITPKSSLDERLNRTVVEGTVLTYQCDSGLSLTGPTTITCGNDGQWSINLATLTCVTPVTPASSTGATVGITLAVSAIVCSILGFLAGLLVMYLITHKKAMYSPAKGQANVQSTVPVGPVYEDVPPALKEKIELNVNQAYGPIVQ